MPRIKRTDAMLNERHTLTPRRGRGVASLAAFSVEGEQGRAGQIDHGAAQAAMAIDPLAYRIGIQIHQGARGGLVDNPETEKAPVGGVKAEDRSVGDANPIM